MSCNATAPVLLSSSQTVVVSPADRPAAPASRPLAIAVQPPVMRSKAPVYAGLPDQPDRAGMRERRKQTGMTVRELQRQRGIALIENSASWSLDACYRQLSTRITSLPSTGRQALQSLMEMLTIDIGPQGCGAAPVDRPASALADFQKKFSKDFDIWLSPSARHSDDMKGLIIVVGEHHYDPAIQVLVRQVMMGFRRTRGDRFFMEGGEALACRERVQKYAMEPEDCRLLEKDSAVFQRLTNQKDEALRRLQRCGDYLQKHLPSARQDAIGKNLKTVTEFIKRYSGQLPASAIPDFNALMNEANEAIDLSEASLRNLQSVRDEQMAAAVRAVRTSSARNYVIVGAYHLQPIRQRLMDLPCIFMVPKSMVASDASLSLHANARTDL